MRRKLIAAAALSALVGCLVSPARGAVLLEKHFDTPAGGGGGVLVETAHGKGWRAGVTGENRGKNFLVFPVAGNLNLQEGSIEMELIRDNETDEETLFMLTNPRGRPLLRVNVYWEGWTQSGPELVIGGHSFWVRRLANENRNDPRKTIEVASVPLPGNIAVGRSFHLVFTWGSSAADCAIYFDGKKLAAKGVPSSVDGIARARMLVVGAEIFRKMRTAENHLNSTLEYLRVHDAPMDGGELYGDAGRFSPAGGTGSEIAFLNHDAARVAGFSGSLVAGDDMTVTMEGTPGAQASFDVARLADQLGEIALSWKGWGVYLEEITFFDEDQVDLRDVEEYRVYVSAEPIGEITTDTPYVESLEVGEQSYAADTVIIPEEEGEYTEDLLQPGVPYYVAVMALMDDDTFMPVIVPKQGLPMIEVEGASGTYEGTFTVDYKDVYPEAVIVARMGEAEAGSALISDEIFEIDTRLDIVVETSPSELKADEESEAEVTVTVTDANGEAVSDHEIEFVLATTSQYTGVVGGGDFADEVGGAMDRRFRAVTDLFGRVTATYRAGFAAKTAIIVARDMTSDDTGAGWVKTYINATAELELEAVQEVAGKALGYSIVVTSSDEWLTADGESEARITALVTKDGIPVEGHRVGFRVTSGTGKIRTVNGETDSDGRARAVYTAGKKIGIVLITAVDHTVGITGSVQIELRSDAPAKITIVLDEDLLPADGRSTSEIEVTVTDINDNPNEGVEVEYAVAIGSGRLRRIEEVTDRNGVSTAQYTAGRIPGRVSIEVTVRSTVPTEEELSAARDLAVAVPDKDFS